MECQHYYKNETAVYVMQYIFGCCNAWGFLVKREMIVESLPFVVCQNSFNKWHDSKATCRWTRTCN